MEILENKYQEAHKLSHTEVLFSYYRKILINNMLVTDLQLKRLT
jgi:hypothetical protein